MSMKANESVLVPVTRRAAKVIPEGMAWVPITHFPFAVGRECRLRSVRDVAGLGDRRKGTSVPNNDVYIEETGRKLYTSREHFRIERNEDGTYALVDRGSSLGTGVDGVLVGGDGHGGRASISDGQCIAIGGSSSPLRYRFLVQPDLSRVSRETGSQRRFPISASVILGLASIATGLLACWYLGFVC